MSIYKTCFATAKQYVRDVLVEWDSDKFETFKKLAHACTFDLYYGANDETYAETEVSGFVTAVERLKVYLGEFEQVQFIGRWMYVGTDTQYVSDTTTAFEGYEYLADDDEEECVEWVEGEPYAEFSLVELLVDSELAPYLL